MSSPFDKLKNRGVPVVITNEPVCEHEYKRHICELCGDDRSMDEAELLRESKFDELR